MQEEEQCFAQIFFRCNLRCPLRQENLNDFPEIFGVGADDYCFSELRGFEDVVSTTRDEAAANKGDCCERVDGRQLADRIE